MTLTTAAIPARLRSTPQKYKIFPSFLQTNHFFCIKSSLPHHTSAITFRISIDSYFHNSCEARPHPSAISPRSSLLHLTSYIVQPSALRPQPSFFPLPSYFIQHISLQPSHITHLPYSSCYRASSPSSAP